MSKHLIDYLNAKQEIHDRLLLSIGRAVLLSIKGPGAKQLEADLASIEHEISVIQPPSRMDQGSWGEERKARLSTAVKESWKGRRALLYYFEYANQDPVQMDYEKAAETIGYAASTLKARISAAPSKSIAVYKGGRWRVLARAEDGLEPALRAKAEELGEHAIVLPTKAKTA